MRNNEKWLEVDARGVKRRGPRSFSRFLLGRTAPTNGRRLDTPEASMRPSPPHWRTPRTKGVGARATKSDALRRLRADNLFSRRGASFSRRLAKFPPCASPVRVRARVTHARPFISSLFFVASFRCAASLSLSLSFFIIHRLFLLVGALLRGRTRRSGRWRRFHAPLDAIDPGARSKRVGQAGR